MTATSCGGGKDYGYIYILLVAVLAVFVTLIIAWPAISQIVIDISQSHAAERHGATTAETVRNCLNDRGEFARWVNPQSGYILRVCQLENGRFGVQVARGISNDVVDEVTAFVKEKMRDYADVARYLQNSGATQIWGPP